jgi:carbamoylphosphate synthase large subunit
MKGCIFPSGSAVTNEIVSSLRYAKNITLIGVNSTIHNEYAILLDTNYTDCPPYTDDDECVKYIMHVCETNDCNFIIPTMDSAHCLLSKYQSQFTECGIHIISSPFETNRICVSKRLTYQTLCSHISCPTQYTETSKYEFPLFLKPDIGYGSKNCVIVNRKEQLDKLYNPDMLCLEYLPGDEFTIDCFTCERELLYVGVRKRVLYKNGLSIITEMLDETSTEYQEIQEFANQINRQMHFVGAWFFQLKYDRNHCLKLLEVSTRIAGASSINRLNGCNLVLLSVLHHFGYPITIMKNNITDAVHKIHHNKVSDSVLHRYENIYVDLDDTLIVGNKVNTNVVSFLYKCRNYGKDVYLITRHRYNILETLSQYCICKELFNGGIIHLDASNETVNKCDCIKEESIFIDDSFRERNFVKKNVLTLDVDSVEFFI